MNKSQQKLLKQIKHTMIDALEVPTKRTINGKKHIILEGDFITLEDFDEKIAPSFDEEFIVNKDEKDGSFLVLIKHVDY